MVEASTRMTPTILLFLMGLGGWSTHAAVLQDTPAPAQTARSGSWTAKSTTGLALGGTWTAVADPTTGAVSGTWTLVDAQGRTVTRGGWSAAKSRTGWNGGWRAAVSGSKAEYSGTWSAKVSLKPDARFVDLFEKAVETAVSGNWRAGRHSGAWSIRAFGGP